MPAQTSRRTHKRPNIEHDPVPTLKCTITPAMFADDRLVRVDLPNGNTISAVVNKSDVTITNTYKGVAKGLLKVRVKGKHNGAVCVELPRPAVNGLQEIEVPELFVHSADSFDGDSLSTKRSVRHTDKPLSPVSNLLSPRQFLRGKR